VLTDILRCRESYEDRFLLTELSETKRLVSVVSQNSETASFTVLDKLKLVSVPHSKSGVVPMSSLLGVG
jgi:hypothetical protein